MKLFSSALSLILVAMAIKVPTSTDAQNVKSLETEKNARSKSADLDSLMLQVSPRFFLEYNEDHSDMSFED